MLISHIMFSFQCVASISRPTDSSRPKQKSKTPLARNRNQQTIPTTPHVTSHNFPFLPTPQSGRVVLNRRLPVSVPPFHVYLFFLSLNVTIVDSFLPIIGKGPFSATDSFCATPVMTTILAPEPSLLIRFTNSTIVAPLLMTGSTSRMVVLFWRWSDFRSDALWAWTNIAEGKALWALLAIGSPPRMRGTIVASLSCRRRYPAVELPWT